MKRYNKILGLVLAGILLFSAGAEILPAAERSVTDRFSFPGMPRGYKLSAEERQRKAEVRRSQTAEAVREREPGTEYEDNTVFFLTEDESYAETVAEAYGGTLSSLDNGVAVLTLPENGPSVSDAVEAGADMGSTLPAVYPNDLMYLEEIEEAEAVSSGLVLTGTGWNEWVEAGKVNDPYLWPGSECYPWYFDMIDVWSGWDKYEKTTDICVAVIDTDVLTTHEELAGRVKRIEIGEDGLLEDGKPYYDHNGHGTGVAGVIAAAGNNSCGGAGIAYGTEIIGIPVFCHEKGAYTSDVIKGVNAAVENGADIINMSFGSNVYNPGFQAAVTEAVEEGTVFLAAMGNNSSNDLMYPAAYEDVIAVGAVDKNGHRAYYSSYGDWCDLSAPGSDFYAPVAKEHDAKTADTVPTDTYQLFSGTSMACPVVAGICALYMSVKGKLSPAELETVLKNSTDPCPDTGCGAGIINLRKLFQINGGEEPVSAESIPASSISVVRPSATDELAYGKSIRLEAVLGATYGQPSEIKAKWSFAVGWDTDGEDGVGYPKNVEVDEKLNRLFHKKKLAKIKNGKLTLSKKAKKYKGLWIEARASTTDDTELTDACAFRITAPAKKLTAYRIDEKGTFQKIGKTVSIEDLLYQGRPVLAIRSSNNAAVRIESSDPRILCASIKKRQQDGKNILYLYPGQTGTVRLTATVLDGTKKKMKIKITS